MSAAARLYELDASCPRCGAPPRIRITARQMQKWADDPPGMLAQTYQCSWEISRGRKCNHIYALTAAAFQEAREIQG